MRAVRRARIFACFIIATPSSLLLAFLAEDELIHIFHALALVGLGLAQRPDLGRGLADTLLVDARQDDLGRLRGRDRDAFGRRKIDLMAVAERQLEHLALRRRAIADAGDLEPFLEALGHAFDEVGDTGSRRPPKRARLLRRGTRVDLDRTLLHHHRHIVWSFEAQLALRALDLDGLAFDRGGDAVRDDDRLLAYTRHDA